MEFARAGRNSIATQTLIPLVVAVSLSLLLITYRLCLRWFLGVFLAWSSRRFKMYPLRRAMEMDSFKACPFAGPWPVATVDPGGRRVLSPDFLFWL